MAFGRQSHMARRAHSDTLLLRRGRTVANRAAVQDVGRGEARRVAGQLALLLLRQLEARVRQAVGRRRQAKAASSQNKAGGSHHDLRRAPGLSARAVPAGEDGAARVHTRARRG